MFFGFHSDIMRPRREPVFNYRLHESAVINNIIIAADKPAGDKSGDADGRGYNSTSARIAGIFKFPKQPQKRVNADDRKAKMKANKNGFTLEKSNNIHRIIISENIFLIKSSREQSSLFASRANSLRSLCSILELVRTHFAATGGEKPPANSER